MTFCYYTVIKCHSTFNKLILIAEYDTERQGLNTCPVAHPFDGYLPLLFYVLYFILKVF